jgi:hypothetical protein
LLHDKRRSTWELEDAVKSPNSENGGGRGSVEATIYISSVGEHLLRDTVIYCAAEKYGLDELKRLALRKQGLQSGIEVATILRSARYAYDNTPDTDSVSNYLCPNSIIDLNADFLIPTLAPPRSLFGSNHQMSQDI